jgi:hypothetical protein
MDFPPEKTTTVYEGENTSYAASAPDYIPEETWYYFRVRAVSDTEASPWSGFVSLKITIGDKPLLNAPVTVVRVNEPFKLRYRSNSSSASTGWLCEEYNSSDITIEIVAGTGEEEITLTRKEPGIYKYTVVFSAYPDITSIPVYVTVLPAKQPVILSVSSTEASYLEDYTLSWNSAGEVDGYEWQEYAGDISSPLATLTFPSQVLEWVCSHRVATESTFLYRVRSFSLDPDAHGEKIFDDWSPAVQVTVHPLQPPAGLAVTGPGPAYGTTSEITWTAVPHADRYRLEMTSGGSSIFLDSETTGISHKFVSLGELTIRVQAISGTDTSAWSAPVWLYPDRPPAPVATLSSNQVESGESYTLDWTIAITEGLEKFFIEENIDGSPSVLGVQPGERSRTFSHETLNATTCTYKIQARYSIGGALMDTPWSDPVSLTIGPAPIATPEAPVASVNPGQIQSGELVTISWNAVTNATSYELNNITDGTTTSVSGTSITVTLENDQESAKLYQFTVTAVNESGGLVARSSESNTVSVDVTPLPVLITPEAPHLTVSPGQIQSGESVKFSWNAVDFATVYELNNITTGKTTRVSGTSKTVKLVNDQQSTKTYQYRVTALNESGGQVARSGASNTVSVDVTPASVEIITPEAPDLTIDNGVNNSIVIFSGESATLRWNAVANATSYELTYYETDFNRDRISGPTTDMVPGTFITLTLYNTALDMKHYEYTVTAVNESGGQVARSSASNKVFITVNPD